MSANEKPWLASYPEGVPEHIDLGQYCSIVDLFNQSVERYRDNIGFSCMGAAITYGELEQQVDSFAAYLLNDLKLSKGDRVAIMMPNCLQYPIAVFGALKAGMTVVNTNPMYTPRELRHQLTDAGVTAIVVLENFASVVQQVQPDVPTLKQILITGLGDLLGFPKSLIVNFVLRHIKKMVPAYNLPDAIRFTSTLNRSDAGQYTRPELDLDDLAFLQYTGGTTGVAKGAMLSHGNLVANMLQSGAWLESIVKPGKEVIITALPLYHIFALTANCLVFMRLGGQNHMIVNPRDMEGFVKELKSVPFTAITGVNTLFNGLLNTPSFSEVDFSTLRLSLGGGMAVQRAVAEKWKQVTGVTLVEAYGLTETSPAACMNPLDLKEYNGMIGLPIPSTDGRVRDGENNDVAVGETGELCIKGPQVMQGYWQRPEETAKTMTADGYLRTGDMAVMNKQGFFKLVDRKKDMILVSGFNVYPNEIEDVVASHPDVVEVGAIGVPDAKSGEVVKIVVVRKDNSLTEAKLKAFCKEQLTGYKVPKYIEFREELPKSNVGKILRRELRDS